MNHSDELQIKPEMRGFTLSFSQAHQLFDFDNIDKALDRGDMEEAYNIMLEDVDEVKRMLVNLKFNKFEIRSVDANGIVFYGESLEKLTDFNDLCWSVTKL
jgi:hypothetical protein